MGWAAEGVVGGVVEGPAGTHAGTIPGFDASAGVDVVGLVVGDGVDAGHGECGSTLCRLRALSFSYMYSNEVTGLYLKGESEGNSGRYMHHRALEIYLSHRRSMFRCRARRHWYVLGAESIVPSSEDGCGLWQCLQCQDGQHSTCTFSDLFHIAESRLRVLCRGLPKCFVERRIMGRCNNADIR